MSTWAVILAFSALGGALILWNTVSRTKAISEQMLRQYADMLADARAQRGREMSRAAEAEVEVAEVAEAQEEEIVQ